MPEDAHWGRRRHEIWAAAQIPPTPYETREPAGLRRSDGAYARKHLLRAGNHDKVDWRIVHGGTTSTMQASFARQDELPDGAHHEPRVGHQVSPPQPPRLAR
jgi:hypothetical protein